jgi:hypothetical protein
MNLIKREDMNSCPLFLLNSEECIKIFLKSQFKIKQHQA